ncbi:MAG: primosomal protein N' [Desulfohalobiaceae bacterium]
MNTYCNVILLSPPYLSLTYAAPEYFPASLWKPGLRVAVPLAQSLRCGIVLEGSSEPESGQRGEIKPILWPMERSPLLDPGYLDLIRDVARHSLVREGYALSQILPGALRTLGMHLVRRGAEGEEAWSLSSLSKLDQGRFGELAREWLQGESELRTGAGSFSTGLIELATDPPWPVRPQAAQQVRLLDFLWTHGPTTRKDLRKHLGSQASRALRTLKGKDMVRELKPVESPSERQERAVNASGEHPLDRVEPTRDQKSALNSLVPDLHTEQMRIQLLHGITGSGKTLVYLLLAREGLEQGRSVLLLVPEIALALQLWREVRKYFPGQSCFLYHGHLTAADKGRLFARLGAEEEPVIAVGTRSAVFLPRKDWGLIVLDEEHDASFKQEERLPYHAKEVAYSRARISGSLLLLGSATPDIKTYHAARSDHFPLLTMQARVGGRELPPVETVDLTADPPREGPFSGQAIQALRDCLERGDQAIILLNRRGYAPLIYCTGCGKVIHCDYCEVGMTYHKSLERVVCHYCGEIKPFPLACPECGGHQYVPLLEGTEQIEEYLSAYLPEGSGVLRLDRDSTRRKGSLEDILEGFANNRAQVLVGTQMCSKGHNFPGVSLVLVLDGDIGLNLPDYRATERTFQLLHQVGGRAGRGEAPGRVMIQTRSPDHYCWQYIRSNDFEGFYATEIDLRRRRKYPPFVRLGLLRISYPATRSDGYERVREIAAQIRQGAGQAGVQILGPAPAPLRQLRGRIRYQCLIKAPDRASIRGLCKPLFDSSRNTSGLRLSLDLDPVQML